MTLARIRDAALEAIDRRFYEIFFAVLAVTALIKSRLFLPSGRLVTDEHMFIPRVCTKSTIDALIQLHNNHLELPTNIGVWMATRVDIFYMPTVTVWYSILLTWAALFLVAVKREELGLKSWAVPIVVLVAMGVPESTEIWAGTQFLPFVFSLVAMIVLIVPAEGRRWVPASIFLLLIAGLSGIPANFIAPLFPVVAFIEKSRARWLQSAVVLLVAGFQIFLLLSSEYDNNRGLAPPVDIILLSALGKNFWGLFFGTWIADAATGKFLDLYHDDEIGEFAVSTAVILLSLYLIDKAFPTRLLVNPEATGEWRSLKALAAVGMTVAASVTLANTANEPKLDLLTQTIAGGRYFWASSVLLAILFLSLGRWTWVRKAFLTLMIVFCANGVFDTTLREGQPWREVLEQANLENPPPVVELAVWPPHFPKMLLPRECIR